MNVLVIANETVGGAKLRGEILSSGDNGNIEVLIVCPALNSRLRHWMSDEDAARKGASERLEASLSVLRSTGRLVRPIQSRLSKMRYVSSQRIA